MTRLICVAIGRHLQMPVYLSRAGRASRKHDAPAARDAGTGHSQSEQFVSFGTPPFNHVPLRRFKVRVPTLAMEPGLDIRASAARRLSWMRDLRSSRLQA